MNFTELLLLPLWSCTGVAGWWGWRLGALPKRRATSIAALLCLLLIAGVWLSAHPALLPDWMVVAATVYFEGSWFALPAAGLFLLGARQGSLLIYANPKLDSREQKRQARRRTALFCALSGTVLLVASNQLIRPTMALDAPSRIDVDNVVLQTTGYTCAGAAAATLLRRLRIDSQATEAEMVHLCLTRYQGGATNLGIAVGLKRKVVPQGWRVRVLEVEWEQFRRLKMPLLSAIKYTPLVNHAIVVCAVDPQRGVQVADPLNGLSWWSEQEFRERFLNEAIVIERDEGGLGL